MSAPSVVPFDTYRAAQGDPTPIYDAVAKELKLRPRAPGRVMRHPLPTFANTKLPKATKT